MTSLEFDPGVVERRIINYYFEGLKRNIYNYTSLRLGRDSQEAKVFKDQVRQILKTVRQTCYEMVTDELIQYPSGVLPGTILADIIEYVLPDNNSQTGPFWVQFDSLLKFTFKQYNEVIQFMAPRIQSYVHNRLPQIRNQYDVERAGAIQHLRSVHGQENEL